MRIDEILNEVPSAGSGPAAAMARNSEEVRADMEYATLKKFSPKFANAFKAKFQLLGKTSVDAAYQAAAEDNPAFGIDKATASAVGKAERGSSEYMDAMNKFKSAMPDAMKSTKKSFVEPKGRGAAGWSDETHGHLRKGTVDFLKKFQKAGDNKIDDFTGGAKDGFNFAKNILSKPVAVSRKQRGQSFHFKKISIIR